MSPPRISDAQNRRDKWVKKWEGALPAGTLCTIVADGGLGTAGATSAKKMTPATADHLLRLTLSSGVAGATGRDYLARVLRWHYGYDSGGAPVASTGRLTPTEAAFIRQRAHELVTDHDNSIDGPLIRLVHAERGR